MTAVAILATIVFTFIVLGLYIRLQAPKRPKAVAELYDQWAEALELPTLTEDPEANSKKIEKHLKVIWDGNTPSEIDVRNPGKALLTPSTVKGFNDDALRLIPKRAKGTLIYDLDDALSGVIRLFYVDKDDKQTHAHNKIDELNTILNKATRSDKFYLIEIPSEEYSSEDLSSFILQNSGITTEDTVASIQKELAELYSGDWLAVKVNSSVLQFRKQTEEDLLNEEEENESNPFYEKIAAKRKADEERKAVEDQIRFKQNTARKQAEELRNEELREAQAAAIASGEISEEVNSPVSFLSSEIAKASLNADSLNLIEEPKILKSDGIGNPVLFLVASNEELNKSDKMLLLFAKAIKDTCEKNLGGKWGVKVEPYAVTFAKMY